MAKKSKIVHEFPHATPDGAEGFPIGDCQPAPLPASVIEQFAGRAIRQPVEVKDAFLSDCKLTPLPAHLQPVEVEPGLFKLPISGHYFRPVVSQITPTPAPAHYREENPDDETGDDGFPKSGWGHLD